VDGSGQARAAASQRGSPTWWLLYGAAKSVNDGGSDQAASNFANNYVPNNPNEAPLTESRFAPGHRINLAVNRQWSLGSKLTLLTSAYYNGQSGARTRPVPPGHQRRHKTGNDLVFIPSSADQVLFTNGTFASSTPTWMAIEGLGKYRGASRAAERAARAVDQRARPVRPAWGSRGAAAELELRADVTNFLNLLNKDWGLIDFPIFNDLAPIPVAIDAATGKYSYNLATITARRT
jgi:hypothetical protein